MEVRLAKDAADLGIVVGDVSKSLAFYRDVIGLEHVDDLPLPAEWSGTMHVLRCGASLVKLVALDDVPGARPVEPGRLEAATGLRYWTIPVSNHDEIVDACERAGAPIVKPTVHLPDSGVRFTLLADPDGNIVEILGYPDDTPS